MVSAFQKWKCHEQFHKTPVMHITLKKNNFWFTRNNGKCHFNSHVLWSSKVCFVYVITWLSTQISQTSINKCYVMKICASLLHLQILHPRCFLAAHFPHMNFSHLWHLQQRGFFFIVVSDLAVVIDFNDETLHISQTWNFKIVISQKDLRFIALVEHVCAWYNTVSKWHLPLFLVNNTY